MVRWYHAIYTAYGFWLPNDPRGSWSDFVGSWELYKFGGAATKTTARRSVAAAPHNIQKRLETKNQLKFAPVRFDDAQRQSIAAGIAQVCAECNIQLLACAIGYDHVHGVVGRNEKTIEDIVRRFKSRTTQHMNRDGCHPMRQTPNPDGTFHSPWAEGCWHVFINDERQLAAAIDYVNRHPEKEGLAPQRWPFISAV